MRWKNSENLCIPYDQHMAEITLLNQKLQYEYASSTLSFKRTNIQQNSDIDKYVDSVLSIFTGKKHQNLAPVYHITNPYQECIHDFRTTKYTTQSVRKTRKQAQPKQETFIDTEIVEKRKYMQYYNQANKLFQLIESLKSQFSERYVPNGAKFYYKDEEIQNQEYYDFKFCQIFTQVNKQHKGLAISQKLIGRLDVYYNWRDMVKAELSLKQLLNGRKLKEQIINLTEMESDFCKVIACIILSIVLK